MPDDIVVKMITQMIRGDDIEWMNRTAQRAKQDGNSEKFEYWRREYLNARAAQRQERAISEGARWTN